MNEKLKAFISRFKNRKVIIAVGAVGVFLVMVSGFFTQKNETPLQSESFNINEYKQQLEQDVATLVKDITSYRATVVITLEGDVKYNYADETKFSDTSRDSDTVSDKTSDSEQTRVIITDSSGNENALVTNMELPQIRGVAVVYHGANSEVTNEKIKNCLMATLSVTSKRIYISGKGGQ